MTEQEKQQLATELRGTLSEYDQTIAEIAARVSQLARQASDAGLDIRLDFASIMPKVNYPRAHKQISNAFIQSQVHITGEITY